MAQPGDPRKLGNSGRDMSGLLDGAKSPGATAHRGWLAAQGGTSLLGEQEALVAQSCPTLGDPLDCSPPGSSVHGISQARILEWVATCFSGSFRT